MNMKMAHPQTPWKGPCEPGSNFQKGNVTLRTGDGELVATFPDTAKGRATARFIKNACNHYEAMGKANLAAAEYLLKETSDNKNKLGLALEELFDLRTLTERAGG